MVCYNIYVFDRNGVCLFYWEWTRPKAVRSSMTALDDQKNMFGLFFSMKTFAAAMDPKGFYSFRTNNYKMHFFESPSGIKIVLNTDQETGDLRTQLAILYESIFVEYVIRNPLYIPGQPIDFELFTSRLNNYVRSLGL